jgi:hypothetical protein
MLVSGRRGQKTGAIGVIGVLNGIGDSSPTVHRIAGFLFDSSNSSQPWTSFTAPSTAATSAPDATVNVPSSLGDIAVTPENNKVVIGGYDNSNNLNIYDLNIKSSPSFGAMTNYSPSDPEELDGVTGLAFSQDKTALAVSSNKYITVYNWENGAISGRRWRSVARDNNAKFAGLTFWPYDQEVRSGPDQIVVGVARPDFIGSGNKNVIRSYALDSSGTNISHFAQHAVPTGNNSSYYFGRANTPLKISPRLIGGSRTVLAETYNAGFSNLERLRYRGFNYQVSNGAAVSYPSGYSNDITAFSEDSQTVSYSMFDPHGRAIVARVSNFDASADIVDIQMYDQSETDGSFTLKTSLSSDIPSLTWDYSTRGIINSMAYDKDRDILFVCHRQSPYLTAIQMSEVGFASVYPDMVTPSPSPFVRASLVYDEKWKSYNS